MKIAFWSSAKGGIGVSSNLASISIAATIEYSCKSVLIENHYQKNRLGNILRYQQTHQFKDNGNTKCGNAGMDYILNEFSAGESYDLSGNPMDNIPITVGGRERNPLWELKDSGDKKNYYENIKDTSVIIKEASMEILDNYLYYIPVNHYLNRYIFDYQLNDNIGKILKASEKFADIIYIDTSNENNLSSKYILEEVDLVVVNLVQNSSMIKYFFDNYSSILDKSVFLFSRYHKTSNLNIQKISKTYSINKSDLAVIPYNIEYQEAVLKGTVVEFLSSNYNCKRKNPNYGFMRELRKAVTMIFNKSEEINWKEE
ncbi:hypothetical protein acsn021_33510 [Anaerocolumna cellulosilytica]|uniref:Uncharacterized protein n=1 Tax=Anaerocolumna cellulosilytica TaxID=433286 RepID=A0A6S6R945_9FIRM|nr:hypothetical protein [Anaerocolumna cellulosilytica]MBB5196826.1 hypothetical protein [Anaerocolumna cellulosilytica]BCJ95782.1 hypothetical protein acsn021_33510 [Anaerocolumna cellulosilytica]